MRQLLSASVCGLSLLFLTVVSAGATTRTVCASGCAYTDLQSAIDAAVFGDTILLRAGQTFVDITLDRSYVDGDRYKGQKRGITLSDLAGELLEAAASPAAEAPAPKAKKAAKAAR